MKLPKHINLTIEHNPHAANYQTAAEWLKRDGRGDPVDYDEMVRLNEVWLIQWYPNTPVGFNAVVASTLEKALAAAMEGE